MAWEMHYESYFLPTYFIVICANDIYVKAEKI